MKRPRIIRPRNLTVSLPEDIKARLDLHLYSEVEGRIPFGSHQKFFIERIQEFFSQERLSPSDRRIVLAMLEEFMRNQPQEWWTEHFQNPELAYRRAGEIIKVFK